MKSTLFIYKRLVRKNPIKIYNLPKNIKLPKIKQNVKEDNPFYLFSKRKRD